jgi:hypothetical protein
MGAQMFRVEFEWDIIDVLNHCNFELNSPKITRWTDIFTELGVQFTRNNDDLIEELVFDSEEEWLAFLMRYHKN